MGPQDGKFLELVGKMPVLTEGKERWEPVWLSQREGRIGHSPPPNPQLGSPALGFFLTQIWDVRAVSLAWTGGLWPDYFSPLGLASFRPSLPLHPPLLGPLKGHASPPTAPNPLRSPRRGTYCLGLRPGPPGPPRPPEPRGPPPLPAAAAGASRSPARAGPGPAQGPAARGPRRAAQGEAAPLRPPRHGRGSQEEGGEAERSPVQPRLF